jgi:putative metallohydrolase (TIGR04338 family)
MLHEVAHHLCEAQPPHGPEFVETITTLAELVMGPELGHVLRVVYAKEGVRWTATMRPAEEPDN